MKTVKIAICDDDVVLRELLRQKIETHCKNVGVICRIFDFDSGDRLLSLSTENIPDILFLDIQMPGRNGMEIARDLRKKKEDMILIFVTALSEYVYEAFDVNAFHYLVKPFEDEKLYQVLNKALQQCEKLTEYIKSDQKISPQAILVKRRGLSTRILLTDIVYAEVFNRKIMLHTLNDDIEYYGKLTDLSEQIGTDFYRTHRAYLVNLKYVEKYNTTTIWLEKGIVPISKKKFTGFVQQYMKYISRKTGMGAGR